MIAYEKYLSIPYLALGRTSEGCDCWGLLCLIAKNEYQIQLPDGKISRRANPEVLADLEQYFDIVDKPEAGVIGLAFLENLHAVLFLDRKHFIEMTKQGVFLSKKDKYRNEFLRFYRLKGV